MTSYIYDRNRCFLFSTKRPATRNATTVAPPAAENGMIAVWGGETWTLKPDHRRKKMHNVITGVTAIVTQAGDPPDGWSLDRADVDAVARKQADIASVYSECKSKIAERYPADYQLQIATGVLEDKDMLDWMAEMFKEANSKVDKITNDKPTTIDWPVGEKAKPKDKPTVIHIPKES